MWKLGLRPDIPFLGILVSKFRCFVFAVWCRPLGCEINIFVALTLQKSKIQRKDPKVEKSTLPPFLFAK
jgi:hypothetical protein